MAGIPVSRADVWRAVDMFAVPYQDPLLSDEEIGRVVDTAARADCFGFPPDRLQPWRSLSVYQVGDVITPTRRHNTQPTLLDRYTIALTVTVAGTSGITEPTWNTEGPAAETVDAGVTWAVSGSAFWTPTYDVEHAIYDAWRLKLAHAVEQYSFAAGVVRENSSDLMKHCREMVAYYAGFITASPQMRTDDQYATQDSWWWA